MPDKEELTPEEEYKMRLIEIADIVKELKEIVERLYGTVRNYYNS